MNEQIDPIADLHQDMSAIAQETKINLANREVPLGSILPMYDDPRHTKTFSSDAESVRLAEVRMLLTNMFPNPENDFAEEIAWHQGFYDELFKDRPDVFAKTGTQAELASALENPAKTASILSLEGIYNWDGNLNVLDTLWTNGVRSIIPVWNNDSEIATGHKTSESHGLTEKGRQLIKTADELGFLLDFSHASPRTAMDAFGIIKNRPPFISHTGSRTIAPKETRCTPDDIAIEVAQRGGLIGIMPAKWMVEAEEDKATVGSVVNSMEHYMRLFETAGVKDGYKRLALGTDYDGMGPASTIPGLELVTQIGPALSSEMARRGYEQEVIDSILLKNAVELFQKNLPHVA